MAVYMVTGCAGFIGSHAVKLLIDCGHQVVGVDNINSAYDVRLKEWRLAQLVDKDNFKFVRADITDRSSVNNTFEQITGVGAKLSGVIHLAAYAGVRYSVENPWVYYDTNVQGTLNLLDACVRNTVEKFVLASSSSLYGNSDAVPFVEHANTDRLLSPYAGSKKAAEELCFSYHHLHGIDVTALRFFTVYGPAGRPDMSPFRFVRWIYEGVPLILYGDGSQRRDFTYVGDIARGVYAALEPLGYEVINLGNDRPIEIREFIKKIENVVGRSAVIEQKRPHAADVSATWANIDKARSMLNWSPDYNIDRGLQTVVDWYVENKNLAQDIAL